MITEFGLRQAPANEMSRKSSRSDDISSLSHSCSAFSPHRRYSRLLMSPSAFGAAASHPKVAGRAKYLCKDRLDLVKEGICALPKFLLHVSEQLCPSTLAP